MAGVINALKGAMVCGAVMSFACLTIIAQQTPKPSTYQEIRATAAAVWNPSADALAAIRKKCGEEGDPSHQENCFLDEMKTAGGRRKQSPSPKMWRIWASSTCALSQVNRLDVAYIEYAFRSNELDGVFLVNGEPSPIDVDDEDLIPKIKLQGNASYAALAQQYPNISLWPGDRLDTNTPTLSNSGWGSQTFLASYILRDGCHACAQVGTAIIAFDFDTQGKFQGTRVTSVVPLKGSSSPSGANTFGNAGVEQIRALAGKEFSITLHANHTTGYSWRLATTLDPANLKLISNVYNASASHALAAPGLEVWTFGTEGQGTVLLHFEYVRPFEKDTPPVKTADFSVVIE